MVETLGKLDRAFDELRYDEMADAIYHFVWGTFCDWYVELVKGAFDDETKAVAAWAFDQILVMLHPLMPFITEELWNAMGERPYELIVAKWPEPEAQSRSAGQGRDRMADRLVSEVRSARTELNVPPGATLDAVRGRRCRTTTLARPDSADHWHAWQARLARIDRSRRHRPERRRSWSARRPTSLPLEGVIDLDAEKARLSKGAEAAEKERDSLAAAPRQSEFHRARQARSGRKGPRRP